MSPTAIHLMPPALYPANVVRMGEERTQRRFVGTSTDRRRYDNTLGYKEPRQEAVERHGFCQAV